MKVHFASMDIYAQCNFFSSPHSIHFCNSFINFFCFIWCFIFLSTRSIIDTNNDKNAFSHVKNSRCSDVKWFIKNQPHMKFFLLLLRFKENQRSLKLSLNHFSRLLKFSKYKYIFMKYSINHCFIQNFMK